jgi:hypothetical protein
MHPHVGCRVCAEQRESWRLKRDLDRTKRLLARVKVHPFWRRYVARLRRDPSERLTIEFGGGGLKGYWACGFAHVWADSDIAHLPRVQYEGASMGACIAAFVVCRVSTVDWIRSFYDLHALTMHGGMCLSDAVHVVLSRVLPENAHTLCTSRLGIWVTHMPTLSDTRVGDFTSKSDLVRWLCTSCHSMYTSPTPTCGAYMDGMVFRYGRHSVDHPTLFIAIQDLPPDVSPFAASKSVVSLIKQGADDAIRLLRRRPNAHSPPFRWLPASHHPRTRTLGCYLEVLVYWVEWSARFAGQ